MSFVSGILRVYDDSRFMAKHGDVELILMLEEAVPPADLGRIGIFRSAMHKHSQQAGLSCAQLRMQRFGMAISLLGWPRTGP